MLWLEESKVTRAVLSPSREGGWQVFGAKLGDTITVMGGLLLDMDWLREGLRVVDDGDARLWLSLRTAFGRVLLRQRLASIRNVAATFRASNETY